jgi:hypothetical protein
MKKVILASFSLLALVACSSGDSGSSSSSLNAGTAPTSTGVIVSANSCAELGAYDTVASCKQVTSAQCYPATRNIQGSTAVCYYPVSGWQACGTAVPSTWSYGTWGSWCMLSNGIYQRSRTATCNRPFAACDCATDAAATETCTNNSTPGYPICGFLSSNMLMCSGAQTPTPTATPSWCSSGIINYSVIGAGSESVLGNVRAQRKTNLIAAMALKGYTLNRERSSAASLATSAITSSESSSSYRVQIGGYITQCTANTGKITVSLIVYRGLQSLSIGTHTSGCTNAYLNQAALSFDQAYNQLTIPTCQ